MRIKRRETASQPDKLIIEFSQLSSAIPTLTQRIVRNKPILIHVRDAKLKLVTKSRPWFKLMLTVCEEYGRDHWTLQEFLSVARKVAKRKAKTLIKYARGVRGGFYGRLLSYIVIAKRIGLAEAKVGRLIGLITSYSGRELRRRAKGPLKFKLDELKKFMKTLKVSTLVTLELAPHEDVIELKVKGVGLFKALPPYVPRPAKSLKSNIINPIAEGVERNTGYKIRCAQAV